MAMKEIRSFVLTGKETKTILFDHLIGQGKLDRDTNYMVRIKVKPTTWLSADMCDFEIILEVVERE